MEPGAVPRGCSRPSFHAHEPERVHAAVTDDVAHGGHAG